MFDLSLFVPHLFFFGAPGGLFFLILASPGYHHLYFCISCESPARQTIHMKYQALGLVSEKLQKNYNEPSLQ